MIEKLRHKHGHARANPITRGEVLTHLNKLDSQTCTGEDGVPYTLLKEITVSDLGEGFCEFLNGIRYSGQVPSEWKVGRISFIPKIKLPSSAADLRPICLTNTVAKLFGRILIHRMRAFLPPCNSFQLGCQPGRQAMDGVNTVKTAISISNRSQAPLCFAKLDIKAAFDSLSHRTIANYLLQGTPNQESLALWDLLTHNEILLEVGGEHWRQSLQQGILQGTAYSAELFSRVLAWKLEPTIH